MVGCHNLADMYQEGSDVAKDIKKAHSLNKRACDGGYVEACPLVKPKSGNSR